jgi:hypothetical protein
MYGSCFDRAKTIAWWLVCMRRHGGRRMGKSSDGHSQLDKGGWIDYPKIIEKVFQLCQKIDANELSRIYVLRGFV